MNTRPERLDKDGFPIPAGFDSAPFDSARRTPERPRADSGAVPPSPQRNEFALNVRNIRLWSADRKYRVLFRNGELFFIRVGGQYDGGQNMVGVAMHFGLIGGLIAALLFRRGEKSPEQIAGLDETHPKDLLAQHKHNFSLHTSEIVESSIEPAPRMSMYGACAGRWTIQTRDGTKWRFQFDEPEAMDTAVRHLPIVLGPVVRAGTRWDEQEQRYQNPNDPVAASAPRGAALRRVLRWLVLLGMLTAAWVHFDFGTSLRNMVGDYLCQEAYRQYEQHDLNGALASLDRAVGWAPRNGMAVDFRMGLHLEMRNWEAALADSYRAAELTQGDGRWVEGRLFALQGLRRHREIAAFCGETLALGYGKRSTMLNSRAYARAHGEFELEEALVDINQAISADGADEDPPTKGLTVDQALKAHNLRAALIDTRGYVLLKLGRNDDALKDFEKAVAHSEAAFAAFGRQIKEDRLRGASRAEVERRSEHFDESRAVIFHHRAQAYQKVGQEEKARQDFADAAALGYNEAEGVY
jgi:tetratricopeptide (TPR) repeat protein